MLYKTHFEMIRINLFQRSSIFMFYHTDILNSIFLVIKIIKFLIHLYSQKYGMDKKSYPNIQILNSSKHFNLKN